ncbi:hypothetical protein F5X96DRAFT_133432 [Biscogniauxia mediterranea]|nr:hypothetical protein F5X96DRAFT_133432 [Biscogniauxia mediterranea]
MPLQIPHPNTALHLYRHLLREATYLPSLCRSWALDRIKSRYRDHRYTTDPRYLRYAHQDLRFLRSANAGHVDRMKRLFYLATGRVGKRRRELSRAYLCKPPASDTAALDEDAEDAKDAEQEPGRKTDWLDNWMLDKVRALAVAQVEQQTPAWPHNMRSSLNPTRVIPTENACGRPFVPRLARNKLKKYWITIFRQLLPPLPQEEWDRLGVLARGEAPKEEYCLRPRRPVARSLSDMEEGEDLGHPEEPGYSEAPGESSPSKDWTRYVTRPARLVEKGSSRKMKSLTGEEDQDPRGHGRPIGTRDFNYSTRKLRRLYARVWEACPIMQKGRNDKWVVVWGNNERKVARPKPTELVFFKGVNLDGTRAKPQAELKPAAEQKPRRYQFPTI